MSTVIRITKLKVEVADVTVVVVIVIVIMVVNLCFHVSFYLGVARLDNSADAKKILTAFSP